MELRSGRHLHFILAIKGGLVNKVLNVNFRGKPALKFKLIKDIYDAEDAKNHNNVPIIHLRDDIESTQSKLKGVKVESSHLSLEERVVNSDLEAFELNYNNGDGERNDGLDDLGFGNMTLKQIKERCRTKKRKYSNHVGSVKEPVGTLYSLQQEDPNFENNYCDLEEPLISWKRKISRNMKRKKKCSRKHVSTSSCNAISVVKSEPSTGDQGFLQSNDDWPAPLNVKVAASESEFSDCQAMIYLRADPDFSWSDRMDSIEVACSEIPQTTNEIISDMGALHHPPEECFCDLAGEASYEFLEDVKPVFDVGVSGWEIVKVDSPEILDYEFADISEFNSVNYISSSLFQDTSHKSLSPAEDRNSDLYDGFKSSTSRHVLWKTSSDSQIEVSESINNCLSETAVSVSGHHPTRESHQYTVGEASYNDMEGVHYKVNDDFSGWQIVKVDSREITNYCSSSSESKKGDYSIYPMPQDVPSESMSPTRNHDPETHDCFDSSSAEPETSWQTKCQSQIQLPDMATDINLQCSENIDGVDHHPLKEIGKDNSPSKFENSVISSSGDYQLSQNLNSCASPDGHLISASYDSPSAEKQSLSSLTESVKCCSIAHGPPHEFTASPQLRDHHDSKPHPPPQRLLSTRKTISPTSQEKLCRALESTMVDDNEHSECRGKLYFAKQTNHRILRAEGLEQFSRAVVTPTLRKPNHVKANKAPQLSRSVPQPACGMSTQSCSENAIAFSQRQMHDIESLATKLTKELKSMKDIMKVRLQLEGTAAPALQQNTNEMRIAIENAARAEETTRRWLSIMTRDCSRFCKIMKLTEGSSSSSENLIHKKRKITFADEAGGKLCHVKVFKDDIASTLASGSEKHSLLVE
ncbi:hypothetical protein SLE2022_099980 [Rubroshorea leprosula]